MKQTTSLNPVIRKALNSLDLQLENELQKYRRKKRKEQSFTRFSSSSPSPRISTPLFVDLKSIPEIMSLPSSDKSSEDTKSSIKAKENKIQSISFSNDSLEEKSNLSHQRKLDLPTFNETPHTSSAKITSHISLEEISSLIHKPKEDEKNEQIQILSSKENNPPNNYLESSEQLLASLSEEEIQEEDEEVVQTQKISFLKSLATPLGIASLLILLVSSVLLSSLILFPESFSNLSLNSLLLGSKSNSTNDTLNNNSNNSDESSPIVANGANLTNEEFIPIELENLSTLDNNFTPSINSVDTNTTNVNTVTIPTNNTPTKNTATTPTTTTPTTTNNVPNTSPIPVLTNNKDLASVLLPPSLRPQPNQTYVTPPTLLPPPNINNSSPSTPAIQPNTQTSNVVSKYLVVMPYSGDNSLNQVRQIVQDAFVETFPDGKRIQIAAFDTEEQAQQYIARLAQSGLRASVYPLRNN